MIKYNQLLNKSILLALVTFFYISNLFAVADFIIFSYDRPMQLYALLESTERYLTGIDSTTIICRSSNKRFTDAYTIVQKRFPDVRFLFQSNNPHEDFKPLVMRSFNENASPYVIFAPDDIIVKNYADLKTCATAAQKHNAYGFFLRLGTHLNASYSFAQPQPIPPLTAIDNNMLIWTFKDSTTKFDWGYPNNVDMTLYLKSDIQQSLQTHSFSSPNTMEASWAGAQGPFLQRTGLCFTDSVIVNIPVNCVQHDYLNNQMHSWTPQQLLELFEAGQKIDIEPLAGIQNKSCHINYDLTFTTR